MITQSDTPITDAVDNNILEQEGFVKADDARHIERRLNAANQRIMDLEQRLSESEQVVATLAAYKSLYTAAVDACSFMQDEQHELGLQIGQSTTTHGVKALRAQRDKLRALLNATASKC